MRKIFTNGCFDVLHRGHLDLLKYCKTLGHVTVGINSDSSVRKLKGSDRPINLVDDRKYLLESLVFVDEVIIFEEETPINLIKKIKPDIIVKGGDYKPEDVVGAELAEVRIFKTVDGYSTTSTIQNISNR
tara:strand:- start:456 stop:845 length:390 start_codon:yes stop_codon:yes gene_type:complete